MPGLNGKYFYNATFDSQKLSKALGDFMSSQALTKGFGLDSKANGERMINRMGLDARLTDIRFMAYMLGTVVVEARETQPHKVQLMKKGVPQIEPKTKLLLSKTVQLWDLILQARQAMAKDGTTIKP
jgi:hypothetical protein